MFLQEYEEILLRDKMKVNHLGCSLRTIVELGFNRLSRDDGRERG